MCTTVPNLPNFEIKDKHLAEGRAYACASGWHRLFSPSSSGAYLQYSFQGNYLSAAVAANRKKSWLAQNSTNQFPKVPNLIFFIMYSLLKYLVEAHFFLLLIIQ